VELLEFDRSSAGGSVGHGCIANMSTSAQGRVIDENGTGVAGLRVLVIDASHLDIGDLGFADTGAAGDFVVSYDADPHTDLGTRQMRIVVFSSMHRQLSSTEVPDVAADVLPIADIKIASVEHSGWTVTLGGSHAATPVRDGNLIRVMIDNEGAWSHIKDAISGAAKSVDLMQLEFDVPADFNAAPPVEHPEIVLSFDGAVDPTAPRPVNKATDFRPERMLLDQAARGVKVRLTMGVSHINWAILGVDILIMLIPLLLLIVFDVGRSWKMIGKLLSGGPGGGFGSVKGYFGAAGSSVDIEGFAVTLYNVVHAKLVLVDETEAIVVGSPFSQSYWDTHDHHVFEPRRGSAAGEPVPVHDVSLSVKGPAVKDIQDAFRLHWNSATARVLTDAQTTAGSNILTSASASFTDADVGKEVVGTNIPDGTTIVSRTSPTSVTLSSAATGTGSSLTITLNSIPAIAIPAPIAAVTDPATEAIASLQLVRTFNKGAFPEQPADGEQGILEAYLRAIERAQTYIYLENQYFTNDTIGQALVAALNDPARTKLQVIVLLNISPDVPFYPVWQSNLIERIRKDAGTNASRIEFFTAWTHDPPAPSPPAPAADAGKPMIMANYVHTKAAIVDGVWATVGSANLDGASLDFFQVLHAIQFGDNRNHELNYVIFNGIDGHPAAGPGTPDAVDMLRLGLWSEHLGLSPTDPKLAKANGDWLTLWKTTAEKKRLGLINNPATIDGTLGRVLAYPTNAIAGVPLLFPWVDPERDYLKSAGISLDALDMIEQTRAFQFFDGTWK
jgi:phosphatidylserine/phosphatidylglycerophosphate/cardiolipin synthase-like enzyme